MKSNDTKGLDGSTEHCSNEEVGDSLDRLSLVHGLRMVSVARNFLGFDKKRKPLVIDVGAGDGRARREIYEMLDGEYLGIDILKEYEDSSKAVNCFAIEDTPESWNGRADVICCSRVLNSYLDVDSMVCRMSRLLTEGGVLLHITPYVSESEDEGIATKSLKEWMECYERFHLAPLCFEFCRYAGLELHMVLCRDWQFSCG